MRHGHGPRSRATVTRLIIEVGHGHEQAADGVVRPRHPLRLRLRLRLRAHARARGRGRAQAGGAALARAIELRPQEV